MTPKTFGSKPSCDIVSQIRAFGMIMVMITEVSPNSAPQITQVVSHVSCGCASRATTTGAAVRTHLGDHHHDHPAGANLAHDVARWLAAEGLRRHTSEVPHPSHLNADHG